MKSLTVLLVAISLTAGAAAAREEREITAPGPVMIEPNDRVVIIAKRKSERTIVHLGPAGAKRGPVMIIDGNCVAHDYPILLKPPAGETIALSGERELNGPCQSIVVTPLSRRRWWPQ